MKELYLYHATDKKYLNSIMKNGLIINPPFHNWKDMNCSGKIFLAFDARSAVDYLVCSDNILPFDDIVLFKINIKDLYPNNIGYDWNVHCENILDIDSCIYTNTIPPKYLHVCKNLKKEPFRDLDDFKNTFIYDIIVDTFDKRRR